MTKLSLVEKDVTMRAQIFTDAHKTDVISSHMFISVCNWGILEHRVSACTSSLCIQGTVLNKRNPKMRVKVKNTIQKFQQLNLEGEWQLLSICQLPFPEGPISGCLLENDTEWLSSAILTSASQCQCCIVKSSKPVPRENSDQNLLYRAILITGKRLV